MQNTAFIHVCISQQYSFCPSIHPSICTQLIILLLMNIFGWFLPNLSTKCSFGPNWISWATYFASRYFEVYFINTVYADVFYINVLVLSKILYCNEDLIKCWGL